MLSNRLRAVPRANIHQKLHFHRQGVRTLLVTTDKLRSLCEREILHCNRLTQICIQVQTRTTFTSEVAYRPPVLSCRQFFGGRGRRRLEKNFLWKAKCSAIVRALLYVRVAATQLAAIVPRPFSEWKSLIQRRPAGPWTAPKQEALPRVPLKPLIWCLPVFSIIQGFFPLPPRLEKSTSLPYFNYMSPFKDRNQASFPCATWIIKRQELGFMPIKLSTNSN